MAITLKKNTNKISMKIAGSFLSVIIAIELGLFVSLYLLVVNTWVREEVNSLVARGENHALVLAGDFSSETIKHVVLMEKGNNQTGIVIQNPSGKTISASQSVNDQMNKHISSLKNENSKKNEVFHLHWLSDSYIASKTPIRENGKVLGNVFMFLSTRKIQKMVFSFTVIFAVLVLFTLLVTILVIFYITRTVTYPILKIKSGTERIAQGNLAVRLGINTTDELGQLANSIENLAEKLNFLKQGRNEFLTAVAHELRTPVTFIKGYADIANRSTTSMEGKERYLTIIQEESSRLAQLMDDLMSLAQLEENEFKIEKRQILIQELVDAVVSKVSGILKQKEINLHVSGDFNFWADLDFVRMEQVLINILMNSYKYSDKYSTIFFSINANKDIFRFIISDEGEGIPKEDLPHVFERFYRVDKSRTRKTGGTGIGLAIVQDIVQLHNGKITVKSIQNQGTSFIIELPYK
ncbi:sensor histidine kinase [Lactococcus petauri]|jgi:signal transduction histidine kinase|uniref:sensor histidine kinase n=1 Tax=Lactococcus petauri TaxID=1940789 RepID=UPI003855074F